MSKIRIGIVGSASRGGSFLKPFQSNPHSEVTALCDINEEGMKECAAEFGIAKTFTDYQQMLDDGCVDAVAIGTPMALHTPMAIAALERGVHVISEVPASVSIEEAKDLTIAASKSKAKYMMAENYCYIPNNVIIGQIVKAGLFGELYFAEGAYIHELKGLNEITKWRRKWQTGINGNTYPTHSLGPVLQWMDDRVVSLSCVGTGHHYKDAEGRAYEQEDSTTMFCRMAKGGLVEIRLDMLSNRPHCPAYYSLQGTDGCYESDRFDSGGKIWLTSRIDHFGWLDIKDFEDEFLPDHWKNPPEAAKDAGHWGGDYWEAQDFIQAILEDTEPVIGIHQAMDMTLPGLVSQISIEQESAWMEVPDSRDWAK